MASGAFPLHCAFYCICEGRAECWYIVALGGRRAKESEMLRVHKKDQTWSTPSSSHAARVWVNFPRLAAVMQHIAACDFSLNISFDEINTYFWKALYFIGYISTAEAALRDICMRACGWCVRHSVYTYLLRGAVKRQSLSFSSVL